MKSLSFGCLLTSHLETAGTASTKQGTVHKCKGVLKAYFGMFWWIPIETCPSKRPKKSWAAFWPGDVKKFLVSFHFFQRLRATAKTWKVQSYFIYWALSHFKQINPLSMHLTHELILCVQITREGLTLNRDSALKSPCWRRVSNLLVPSSFSWPAQSR